MFRRLWSHLRPKKAYEPGTSLLEKLPGELRNRIYDLVLPTGQQYDLSPRTPSPPAICRVSTFFRNETLAKWRSENKWTIPATISIFDKLEWLALHAGMKHVHSISWQMLMIFPRPVFEKKRVRINVFVCGQDYSICRVMDDDEFTRRGVRIWPDEEASEVVHAKQEEMLAKLEEVLQRKFFRYPPRA
ncbi:hypothetical protein LTR37_001610 [Vermiconidia calcicola]|uniref:Uncharacterized protein n=1 Tax=Vermiconidia calcicola TaxID=1690605 RepID=A0ACC3NV83_9PEZI|nr:hypothetical protein LTR37_001610 [Vermiconidia calcicola]